MKVVFHIFIQVDSSGLAGDSLSTFREWAGMKILKKLVDITSAEQLLKVSVAIFADANARNQRSLLHARNLSEFIDMINLEMSGVFADETDAPTEWVVL